MTIELWKIVADITHEGALEALSGATETETLADLAKAQEDFDLHCQGVPLADPSSLASKCASAGRWAGSFLELERHAPNPSTLRWYDQFGDIVDRYCEPD